MSESAARKFGLLPMLGHTKGKRSPVTCALKCDNACSGEVCNTSSNAYFRDIASAAVSRRAALGLGAVGALAVVLGGLGSAEKAVAGGGAGLSEAAKTGFDKAKLKFTPIKPVAYTVDAFTVPDGFAWQPIIRWGDPLFADSPAFELNGQTAAAQARQFGYNNDYTDILPIPDSKDRRAVLFTNHEYTNENIMFPATLAAAEARAIGRAAHGLTVVELERKNRNKPWNYVKGAPLNRRFLTDTTYELTGPAAGTDLVGLFKVTLDGSERGRVEQFLAVPRDAETCGPIVHDDERTVFVAVQHPGEEGTFDAPHSYFPDYVGAGAAPAAGQVRAPRPSIVQVFRKDG